MKSSIAPPGLQRKNGNLITKYRRFWVKERRHSESVSAKEEVYLITPYRITRQSLNMTDTPFV